MHCEKASHKHGVLLFLYCMGALVSTSNNHNGLAASVVYGCSFELLSHAFDVNEVLIVLTMSVQMLKQVENALTPLQEGCMNNRNNWQNLADQYAKRSVSEAGASSWSASYL